MKIAYQSTMDETVQDLIRIVELSGEMKRFLRTRLIFVLVAIVAVFLLSPNDAVQGAQLTALTGGFYLTLTYIYRRGRLARTCRKRVTDLFGSDAPIDAEYEVNENGVTFRQSGEEFAFEWCSVVSVKEKHDVIEVIAQPSGIARIPNRIFQNSEERDAWLAYINNHTH